MTYSSEAFYIERLQPSDALHLNKLLVSNNERLKRFLPKTLAANRTFESSKTYIKDKLRHMENQTEYVYTIKDKPSKNIAGLLILKNLDWQLKKGEFAYCIGEDFEGKGWMSEAVKMYSEFALKQLKLKTLQIIVHKNNVASLKVAENSGYLWKSTLINEFTPLNEKPLNMELYELCETT